MKFNRRGLLSKRRRWYAHVSPNLDQVRFRGYADDGGEGSATAKAAENANWTQDTDENFRIRMQVDETAGGTENNITLQLQYNLASAGWNDVDDVSSVVRSSASTHITEEGATTEQLTAPSGSFVAGAFDEDEGLAGEGNQIDFPDGGEFTECEYCCQIRSADVTDGQTVQLRVVRSGGSLDAHSAIPTITINEPAATRRGQVTWLEFEVPGAPNVVYPSIELPHYRM